MTTFSQTLKGLTKPKSLRLEGDGLILLAMALFGSYALFLRLFPGISTLAFLFSFQVVGAITLLIVNKFRPAVPSAKELGLIAVLAIVALGLDLTYFVSLRATSVANAAFAHQSVSIYMLFLAPLLLKKATNKEEWIALVLALIGIGILYAQTLSLGHDASDLFGLTMAILSGLFYALLIIMYSVIPARGLNIRTINFWRYVIATLVLIPLIPLMGLSTIRASNILLLVIFAILFAVVASGLHNLGMSQTRPLHASILGKTEPVFAVIYAFLILGQTVSLTTIIGGLLILGSSVWLSLQSKGKI